MQSAKVTREIDNRKGPVVLLFDKLNPIPSEKVFFIEEVLKSITQSFYYPYPIYCIGHCPNYFGQLQFIESKNQLPKFYFFKTKNTSKLHSELLLFNQIAQREYECINFKRAEEIKLQYASAQKSIFNSDCELKALKHIGHLVKKNFEQEDD